MKYLLCTILTLLLFNFQETYAQSKKENLLNGLYFHASENLNRSTSLSEDSIIHLCNLLRPWLRSTNDQEALFRVDQIKVNAYCLKGDFGLAAEKATRMFETAKLKDSQIGLALSLQAIANTYTHTNRFEEADKAYAEAAEALESIDNPVVKVRLALQHLYLCAHNTRLGSTRIMGLLNEVERLLPALTPEERLNYQLSYYSFQLFRGFATGDSAVINGARQEIDQLRTASMAHNRLHYATMSYYLKLKGDFQTALLYQDSTLQLINQAENTNEYIKCLKSKARVLEKTNNYKEAYLTHRLSSQLNDSLSTSKYSYQMDSLHVMYRVDQQGLESSKRTNRLLTSTILTSLFILAIIIGVIILIKHQNRLLVQSRKFLANESDKASHAIQSKSMFLSNMSHEIRTPLNGIVGFSQFLATSPDIDEKTKEQCEANIRQNADLLLKLVNDVIDLSDLEERTMPFTFDPHNAVDICLHVTETVSTVKRSSAKLSFTTAVEELMLTTDSERLQQVLINLLVNATKFTESGTIKLLLDVDQMKNEAIFTIEDTGCGIPPEKQPNIFKRFEKLDEKKQGSGLGLSICQLIVERFGGRIWLDPTYKKGAKFIFTHPLNNTFKHQ